MKTYLALIAAFFFSGFYCFGQAPEINITGNSVTIADGDMVATTADHTDFGSVLTCNGNIVRTFTIENTGTGDLHIFSLNISGANAADFTVITSPPGTIPAGNSAVFQVYFDPSADGIRDAVVTLNNDDADESVYDFAIRGTGNADIVPPTAICRNFTVYLNASSSTAVIVPPMINNGSYDNCGIASMSVSPNMVSCANVGPTTVTLTITDNSGNTSACTSVVTVMDSLRPVVACHDTTLYITASGDLTVTPAMLNNFASDACGIASLSVFPNHFTCGDMASGAPLTFTATDVNGNSNSCISHVNIYDGISPVAVCQNLTVYLNSSGNATITPGMINNGSYDECGIVSINVNPNTFNISDTGTNNVTLSVYDSFGHIGTCNSVVTVIDTFPAFANCQNITVYLDSSGTVSITPGMVNNNSSPACGIASMSVNPSMFSCANMGPNNVDFSVTDSCGRTSTCTAVVTVYDNLNPVAVCQNITVNLDASGNASITPAMINNGSHDECGIVSMSVNPNTFNCSNLGPNNVTFTVHDSFGHASSCTAIVTVASSLSVISIVNNPVGCNGGNDGQASAIASGGAGPYTYSWSPAGGTGAIAGSLSAGSYTCTITDANGCTITTSITITEPTLLTSASSATAILCNAGSSTVTVTASGGTAPYSGTGTFTETAGTYSYTITDANGCTSTTSVTITEPTLLTSASSATAILCNAGSSTVTVTASGGTAPYSGTGTFTETAGTYSYTITDANGCTSTTSVTITEPALLTSASSATTILCNGGSATVTVTANGGTAPYSGTGTFTETAGSYSYTITDANGCTSTTSVTITEPTLLTSASSATAILCNGGSATVTVTANGGTAPYSGTGTFTETAGSYSYTITDANGCTSTTSVTITEPTLLTSASSATAILCNGGSTTVTVTANGGTAPYSGTGTFTEIAGTYSYTITDANGCTSTASLTITEPTLLTSASSATAILCNGGSATVTVTASGGTAPYSGTGTFIETAGTYSYTVTDANGCTSTSSVSITEPTLLTSASSATAILCNGGSSTVTVTASGGTAPYSGTGTFTETAGTYSYTVTDANGCTSTTSVTITEPALLTSASSATAILCNAGSSTVTVTANGGTAPYSGTGTFTETAGTYSYTVTDANGCTSITSVTITEPAALSAVVSSASNPTTCNGSDGTIDISVSGGTGSCSYAWSNSATTEDIGNLPAGSYSCTIIDANGCTTAISATTLTDPAPPIVTLVLNIDTACQTTTAPFILTGESPAGGSWSGSGVSGNTFDPVQANIGFNVISYNYTDPQTGCEAVATDSIWVDLCSSIPETSGISWNVYPNPNDGNFSVLLNTDAQVIIYNSIGQEVYSQEMTKGTTAIDLSAYPDGLYIVSVINAQSEMHRICILKQ